jgi:hypothetical protein
MPVIVLINERKYRNTKDDKPFDASRIESTMKKYCDIEVQIILYIWRTYMQPAVQPRSDEEVENQCPPCCLTNDQWECLGLIKHITGYDDEEDDSDSDSDYDSEEGWLSPLMYTLKQSAVVTTSRMLVLYQSSCQQRRQINEQLASGYNKLVQEMASRFMILQAYDGDVTIY